MTTPPRDAEQLDLYRYSITRRQPSKFVPGQEAITAHFHCPGCELEMPTPRFDTPTPCPKCGLISFVQGVSLYVWREDTAPQRRAAAAGGR